MLSAWRKRRRKNTKRRGPHRSLSGERKLAVESLESRRLLTLVNFGVVEGSVYVDHNANSTEDAGEEISNAQIQLYRDANNNGTLDGNDQQVASVTTDANGDYSFTNLAPDNYLIVQPQQTINGNNLSSTSRQVTIGSGGTTGTVIDDFNVQSGPTVDDNTFGFTEVNHSNVDAVGGERDFLAEVTSGVSPQDNASLFAGNGILSVASSFDATARFVVTWDGTDAPNLGVNHQGLGNLDLTEINGVTGSATGICLHNVRVDHSHAVVRFRVYTAANQFSEAVITDFVPFVAQDVFIPFSGTSNGISFTNSGLNGQAGPADFTDVGAISLEISSDELALDGRLELINAVGPVTGVVDIVNAAPVAQIQIEKSTNGADADVAGGADVPIIAPGGVVTWTYEVTNDGDAALTNVIVIDDREGTISNIVSRVGGNQDDTLDPGETWTYEETGTAQTGAYENKATVTGSTSANIEVMAMDLSHYLGAAPQIDIEKSTNGADADLSNGNDVPNIEVGDQVTWTYRVENTGTLDLQNVVLRDNVEGQVTQIISQSLNSDSVLQVGEVWTFRHTGVASAGLYANSATVTATATTNENVSATDPSHYIGTVSDIDIEKFTNNNQADTSTDADVPQVFVGEQVVFTYVVTNTGTVPITNVVVVDDNGTPGNTADDFSPTFVSGDVDNDLALDVTETWNYRATREATVGLHTNISEVTGRDPNQAAVDDTDASNHVGVEPPPIFGKRRFLASSFP